MNGEVLGSRREKGERERESNGRKVEDWEGRMAGNGENWEEGKSLE